MRAAAAALVAGAVLAGCGPTRTDDYSQPITRTRSTTTVTVREVDVAELGRLCGPLAPRQGACARTLGDVCFVYMLRRPATWLDHAALALQGHELEHCFGASHAAPKSRTAARAPAR